MYGASRATATAKNRMWAKQHDAVRRRMAAGPDIPVINGHVVKRYAPPPENTEQKAPDRGTDTDAAQREKASKEAAQVAADAVRQAHQIWESIQAKRYGELMKRITVLCRDEWIYREDANGLVSKSLTTQQVRDQLFGLTP